MPASPLPPRSFGFWVPQLTSPPRPLVPLWSAALSAANVTSNLPRLSPRAGASHLFLTKHFQSTLGFLHGWLNCLCLFRTLLLFLRLAADLCVSSLQRRKLTGSPSDCVLAGQGLVLGTCLGHWNISTSSPPVTFCLVSFLSSRYWVRPEECERQQR